MALPARLDFAVAGTAFVVARSKRFVVSDERRVGEAVLYEHELKPIQPRTDPAIQRAIHRTPHNGMISRLISAPQRSTG